MELRVLKYFIEIAREQNITSAANRLHLSQPALSKQIQDLEDELGVKLLNRGKKKTTLTEDGMYLFKRALEIVSLTDKTISSFKSTNEEIVGEINIACGETPNMNLIIDVIKLTQEKHKDIKFNLYSGNYEDASEKLNNGICEFGLFINYNNLNKYNYIKLPVNETWGFLINKNNPLAKKEYLTHSDLLDQKLIVSRQALINNELNSIITSDLENNVIGTYNLIFNASLMVKKNLGIVLSLDNLIKDEDLIFKRFKPLHTSPLFFVYKKYQVFSKASEFFLNNLINYLKRFNSLG